MDVDDENVVEEGKRVLVSASPNVEQVHESSQLPWIPSLHANVRSLFRLSSSLLVVARQGGLRGSSPPRKRQRHCEILRVGGPSASDECEATDRG